MARKNRKRREDFETEEESVTESTTHSKAPREKHRNFIASIFHEMRLTTWPKRRQAWHDFAMVVEYTIFFMAFIILFDWVVQHGMSRLMDIVQPFLKKL
ncbi:MAG: preprotein translocase subunit SecE [Streptococcaceae bacterium]|jgi:preprotein translocase subunit SecE|nr:preprotein translocase subunit SecE [Streptococcaceae bacterium]